MPRGKIAIWGEAKEFRPMRLTPTAWGILTEISKKRGCSRTDLIEQIARDLAEAESLPKSA